jgi:hypothetical protein
MASVVVPVPYKHGRTKWGWVTDHLLQSPSGWEIFVLPSSVNSYRNPIRKVVIPYTLLGAQGVIPCTTSASGR